MSNFNSKLKRINVPLVDHKYWSCIEKVNSLRLKNDIFHSILKEKLQGYSLADIKGFHLKTNQLVENIKSRELQHIAIQMSDIGCSDDGLDYFIYWVISQGKLVYQNTKLNPKSLIINYRVGGIHNYEEFGYVAYEVFYDKTNEDLKDYLN
ncbi:DUF4240 domain-containing protein [Polaribacter sp. Hel_I_88]|uniref:DUF4240 domain-containing protein n=1 Tax=Polaribacter sp. Hel_I_88 TaxID=1250006 RepID=UPI00068EFBE0|nr:DUF4240 domain-containing protein [Polaribacter sp. Hel_I_88]